MDYLWPASLSLLYKNITISWCCRHHVSRWKWFVEVDAHRVVSFQSQIAFTMWVKKFSFCLTSPDQLLSHFSQSFYLNCDKKHIRPPTSFFQWRIIFATLPQNPHLCNVKINWRMGFLCDKMWKKYKWYKYYCIVL